MCFFFIFQFLDNMLWAGSKTRVVVKAPCPILDACILHASTFCLWAPISHRLFPWQPPPYHITE